MESSMALVVSGQVIGAAVHTDGDTPVLRFIHLQRTKSDLRILGHGVATNAADLRMQCGTRVPLAIVLSTPRCLHRVVDRTGILEELLPQTFPGASIDQLYGSGWTEGLGTGLSMMRRAQALPILDPLRAAGYRIVALHVGPWALLHLRPLLGHSGNDIDIGGQRFAWSDGTLTAYSSVPDEEGTTLVGTDMLPSTHLLALATAWEYLMPATQRLALPDPQVTLDQREEGTRVWYERGLVVLAIALLVLLGTDSLLKANIRALEQDPHRSASDRLQLEAQIVALRAQVGPREALAQQLGFARPEPFAVRAMRILDNVPSDILLDAMAMDPLKAALRERERPSVEAHHIRIQGTCPDGQRLNAWMNELRKVPGVQNIRLISFTTDVRTKRPAFEIDLEA